MFQYYTDIAYCIYRVQNHISVQSAMSHVDKLHCTDGGSGNQHLSRAEKLQKMKFKKKHSTGASSAKSHGDDEAGGEHRRGAPLPPPARKKDLRKKHSTGASSAKSHGDDEAGGVHRRGAPLPPPARKKDLKKKHSTRALSAKSHGDGEAGVEHQRRAPLPPPARSPLPPPARKKVSMGLADAIVQPQARKMSNVKRVQNKNSKKILRKKTTPQKVENPMAHVNRMFRRFETSIGGREYFENVNKPGQTTWELPENAVVINGKPVGKSTSTKKKNKDSSFNYSTTQESPDPNHRHKSTTSRTLIEMSMLRDQLFSLPNDENDKNGEQERSLSLTYTSKSYKRPTCSLINAFRLFCGELCCCLFCIFVYFHVLHYLNLFIQTVFSFSIPLFHSDCHCYYWC
jgi:hypothetical protein